MTTAQPLCERILVPATGLAGDANIRQRHPGEAASWVWHPGLAVDELAVLRFSLEVDSPAAGEEVVLHLSADQRFQFRLDGGLVACGPDRGSPERWAVHSYRLRLAPGAHRLEALVWWLGARAPMAQMSLRGGFLCAAEPAARFATGSAPWRVERLEHALALGAHGLNTYHDAGPCIAYDLARWRAGGAAVVPVVVARPPDGNPYGLRHGLWRLQPSILPEQRHDVVQGGVVRAVRDGAGECWQAGADPREPAWQALVDGRGAVEVQAHSQVSVLWDLQDYRCGWCEAAFAGGAGAEIEVEWAESLFDAESEQAVRAHTHAAAKGDRAAWAGKVWTGVGDRWRLDGGASELPALWWRAGRWLRVRVRTAEAPLRLARLGLRATGFPFGPAAPAESDDPAWERTRSLLERVLRACAHETWVDTPYYEQLCYVGDSRLDCLANYVLWDDDRLCRRTIELLDWSSRADGLVAERFPSRQAQASTTFAMLWVLMVEDHLMWRGDRGFIRARLPGLRGVVEHLLALRGADGLLGRLPGWSFVDWVRGDGWVQGIPPGAEEGRSSLINLHLVLALQAAARIERAVGEEVLAARCEALAQGLGAQVVARWWDEARGLMRDDDAGVLLSEHAQALALLAGILDPARAARCVEALDAGAGMVSATISFSFYVHQALYRAGRPAAVERRLAWWKTLPGRGLLTTLEHEDPVRSDCHAWGAHPRFHETAEMAGVQPLEPGLERVLVAPQPGTRGLVAVEVPHPGGGRITVRWQRQGAGWRCRVVLPPGVTGSFRLDGFSAELAPGINELAPAAAGARG
jgi:alpha-L-rhamnosidase